jgi:carbon storage regulator
LLILARKNNESIIIGDDIEVSIVDITPTTVKLGIKAPSSIPVHRKEIFELIHNENIMASRSEIIDLSKLSGELLRLKGNKKEQDGA